MAHQPAQLLPSILSFVKDPPNLLSLAGLFCTIFAIYFSILGAYYMAMIGMIWAVAFDWLDGIVARKMKGRTGDPNFCAGVEVVGGCVTPNPC